MCHRPSIRGAPAPDVPNTA